VRDSVILKTTVGSSESWGGLVTENQDSVAEQFGIINLNQVKGKVISISNREELDALVATKPDQSVVLLINGETALDKLQLLGYVDMKLRNTVNQGKILRDSFSLLVRGDHIRPNELVIYTCQGADAIVLDIKGSNKERENLLSAVVAQELKEFIGAMGANSRMPLIGSRDLLGLDPLVPQEVRERLGISWLGEG